MRRIKQWLVEKYLPTYAREALQEENTRLKRLVTELEEENARQQAYISGVHDALRTQRRIVIQTGGKG